MYINIDNILKSVEEYGENENLAHVGYFPKVEITKGKGKNKAIIGSYPAGKIFLKYGFQHKTEKQKGFGLRHILTKHKKDKLLKNLSTIEELLFLLKSALKKNSKIYFENIHDDKALVISNIVNLNENKLFVKVVLNYVENEQAYSVTTFYDIQKNIYSSQINSGKIIKSLVN